MRRAILLLAMALLVAGCMGEAIMATVPWMECPDYPRAQIDTIGWVERRDGSYAPITSCVLDPRIRVNP